MSVVWVWVGKQAGTCLYKSQISNASRYILGQLIVDSEFWLAFVCLASQHAEQECCTNSHVWRRWRRRRLGNWVKEQKGARTEIFHSLLGAKKRVVESDCAPNPLQFHLIKLTHRPESTGRAIDIVVAVVVVSGRWRVWRLFFNYFSETCNNN